MTTVPERKNPVKSKVAIVPAKKIATAAAKVSAAKALPKVTAVKVAAVAKPVIAKPAIAKLAPVVAAKSAVKAAVKPNGKLVSKPIKPIGKLITPAKPTPAMVLAKEKTKKDKLVRDSFTMPESEYAALGLVKKACIGAGVEVKKSQLLRIGLLLLSRTDVPSLKTLIANLAPLKAGRPKKDK